MLKADFHIHTSEDPYDDWIKHSAKGLIDKASREGFDVLSITNHGIITYNEELTEYAKDKGILLIPGIEQHIDGKEVIIINAPKSIERVKTFMGLKEWKRKHPNMFVMAPHPFYPKRRCLKNDFFRNIDVFDGVEYCHYYCNGYNPYNKKAKNMAIKYNKTLIGTSDAHRLIQFNKTYSFIDADQDIDSVIKALKENKVEIRTRPLSYLSCIRAIVPMTINRIKKGILNSTKSL